MLRGVYPEPFDGLTMTNEGGLETRPYTGDMGRMEEDEEQRRR